MITETPEREGRHKASLVQYGYSRETCLSIDRYVSGKGVIQHNRHHLELGCRGSGYIMISPPPSLLDSLICMYVRD